MTELSDVAVVYLAAGRSLRHGGGHKLYRPLGGKPLGLHAAGMLAALPFKVRIAVCASHTADLVPALNDLGFATHMNPDAGRGLSSSLAIGVEAALAAHPRALLVCLADMPFVTPGHVAALVARLDPAHGVDVVASRAADGEARTPPAVFAGPRVRALLDLTGDVGARALLTDADTVTAPARELADFDRDEDFLHLDAGPGAG